MDWRSTRREHTVVVSLNNPRQFRDQQKMCGESFRTVSRSQHEVKQRAAIENIRQFSRIGEKSEVV
jgi:hypothetical protein